MNFFQYVLFKTSFQWLYGPCVSELIHYFSRVEWIENYSFFGCWYRERNGNVWYILVAKKPIWGQYYLYPIMLKEILWPKTCIKNYIEIIWSAPSFKQNARGAVGFFSRPANDISKVEDTFFAQNLDHKNYMWNYIFPKYLDNSLVGLIWT